MRERAVLLRAGALVLLLGLAITMSGCGGIYSNYREIEELALIQTVGVDSVDGGVRLSVSGGSGSDKEMQVRMSAEGNTIADAKQRLQMYSAREELYYAHVGYVLVGESTALDYMTPLLDYMERSTQLRPDIALLSVRGDNASEAVIVAGSDGTDITDALSSAERDIKENGDTELLSLREVVMSLALNGAALVCAVETAENGDVMFDSTGQPVDTVSILLAGYAILKGDRLAGYVDEDDRLGVGLLRSSPGTPQIELELEDGIATVSIESGSAEFEPMKSENGLNMRVSVSMTASLSALSGGDGSATLTEIEEALAAYAAERVSRVLSLSSELEADFLGLSKVVAMKRPELYDNMEGWQSAIANTDFQVEVTAELTRSYGLDTPHGADEKGGDKNAEEG